MALPSPDLYNNWQEFAQALVTELQRSHGMSGDDVTAVQDAILGQNIYDPTGNYVITEGHIFNDRFSVGGNVLPDWNFALTYESQSFGNFQSGNFWSETGDVTIDSGGENTSPSFQFGTGTNAVTSTYFIPVFPTEVLFFSWRYNLATGYDGTLTLDVEYYDLNQDIISTATVRAASGAADTWIADTNREYTVPATAHYLKVKISSDSATAGSARVNWVWVSRTQLRATRNEFRGAWATSTEYDLNDLVTDGGRTWICVTAHTSTSGNRPETDGTNNTWWELFADSGSDGAGVDGDDGASVDIIFQRAASQPATPAASAGTPTGWYSDVNSVPASSDILWSSVGQRAGGATNYTWDVPVQAEGIDGADGADGATGPQGPTGADGPTGPRTATGFVYYQINTSSPPSTPTATSFNFETGQFTGLTTNWSVEAPTFEAGNGNAYWYAYFAIEEATYEGTQALSFSTPVQGIGFTGLVTFSAANSITDGTNGLSFGSSGTTTIDGGNITTGTISANRLNVDGATISVNGSGELVVNAINASQITAGTLNTSRINIDGITLENSGGTLQIGTADWSTNIGGAGKPDDDATRNTLFSQPSAPTANGIGDMWFDTDDELLYRWNGSAWVLFAPSGGDTSITVSDGGSGTFTAAATINRGGEPTHIDCYFRVSGTAASGTASPWPATLTLRRGGSGGTIIRTWTGIEGRYEDNGVDPANAFGTGGGSYIDTNTGTGSTQYHLTLSLQNGFYTESTEITATQTYYT